MDKKEQYKTEADKLLLLPLNDRFKSEVRSIRKKLNIPPEGFNEKNAKTWRKKTKIPSKQILKILREPLNLSEKIDENLANYIFRNEIDRYYFVEGRKVVVKPQKLNIIPKEDSILIQVYGDTRLKDVAKHWHDVELFKEVMDLPFREEAKEAERILIERDCELYRLHKTGMEDKKIYLDTDLGEQFSSLDALTKARQRIVKAIDGLYER